MVQKIPLRRESPSPLQRHARAPTPAPAGKSGDREAALEARVSVLEKALVREKGRRREAEGQAADFEQRLLQWEEWSAVVEEKEEGLEAKIEELWTKLEELDELKSNLAGIKAAYGELRL